MRAGERGSLRHHRTYSSVSSRLYLDLPASSRHEEKRTVDGARRNSLRRKSVDGVGESEKIFLDMSSHCVTNIWEWSRGILRESCLIFPPNGEADVAENLNIGNNKIRLDEVSRAIELPFRRCREGFFPFALRPETSWKFRSRLKLNENFTIAQLLHRFN